jgi:hypothetical protein
MMMLAACDSGGGNNINSSPDMAMSPGSCTPSTANQTQLVAKTLLLPLTRTDYAIDLNGDGRLDNQLSALVAVLKSQGTDANVQIENGILNGDQILLFDETSADATYQSDGCAGAGVFTGQAAPMPDLTGNGHFAVDTTVPSGKFQGAITAGDFESISPLLQTTPVTLTLELVLFANRTISLPIIGAQLKLTRDSAGAVSGELHGAIKKDDVQSSILPTFAAELQEQVTTMPTAASSQQILGFFDDGGSPDPDGACNGACKDADGTCAVAGDGKLATCEITTNALVQSEVAPDVQMFSDDGSTYQPSAANMHKDSFSLGIAFTDVAATF